MHQFEHFQSRQWSAAAPLYSRDSLWRIRTIPNWWLRTPCFPNYSHWFVSRLRSTVWWSLALPDLSCLPLFCRMYLAARIPYAHRDRTVADRTPFRCLHMLPVVVERTQTQGTTEVRLNRYTSLLFLSGKHQESISIGKMSSQICQLAMSKTLTSTYLHHVRIGSARCITIAAYFMVPTDATFGECSRTFSFLLWPRRHSILFPNLF